MSKLVESILENDFVTAQAIFEERINAIAEKKLLENKKMIQEQNFPYSLAGVEARKKAGFKRAIDVLGDPTATRKKPLVKLKKKKIKEAVEVQPDPEGKVRGGKEKTLRSKSTKEHPIMRKIAATILKAGRKVKGKEFTKSYLSAKKSYQADQEKPKSQFPDDMHKTQTSQPKTSDEVHGYGVTALKQRANLRRKEAAETREKRSQEAEKSAAEKAKAERDIPAWKRSIGGKIVTSAPSVAKGTAKGALGAAKLGGRILSGMMAGI